MLIVSSVPHHVPDGSALCPGSAAAAEGFGRRLSEWFGGGFNGGGCDRGFNRFDGGFRDGSAAAASELHL